MMSPHQTVAVAVRIFTVWLLLYSTSDILSFYFDSEARGHAGALTVAFAALALTCAVGAALWAFPLTVARKLLPPSAAEPAPPATPDAWLAVGCTLIGLWVLSSAVPLLFRDLLMHALYPEALAQPGGNLYVFRYVAEIVIAVWLVCGAKGVAAIFRWARSAGVSKAL
jgi:hypothetical protein